MYTEVNKTKILCDANIDKPYRFPLYMAFDQIKCKYKFSCSTSVGVIVQLCISFSGNSVK